MRSTRKKTIDFEPGLLDNYIGKRLKLRRSMLQLSQDDVAAMIGVTFQQVQKYECGCTRISASRLFVLAKILQVDINFFFDGLEREVPEYVEFTKQVDCVSEDKIKFDPMSDNKTLELINLYWKVEESKREVLSKFLDTMGS